MISFLDYKYTMYVTNVSPLAKLFSRVIFKKFYCIFTSCSWLSISLQSHLSIFLIFWLISHSSASGANIIKWFLKIRLVHDICDIPIFGPWCKGLIKCQETSKTMLCFPRRVTGILVDYLCKCVTYKYG